MNEMPINYSGIPVMIPQLKMSFGKQRLQVPYLIALGKYILKQFHIFDQKKGDSILFYVQN